MRPTLGRVVIFTRASGEEFAARITRVIAKPEPTEDDLVARKKADPGKYEGLSLSDMRAHAPHAEGSYEVWLAVDMHTKIGGRTWYTDQPIAFDAQGMALTWRWPEIVR